MLTLDQRAFFYLMSLWNGPRQRDSFPGPFAMGPKKVQVEVTTVQAIDKITSMSIPWIPRLLYPAVSQALIP